MAGASDEGKIGASMGYDAAEKMCPMLSLVLCDIVEAAANLVDQSKRRRCGKMLEE